MMNMYILVSGLVCMMLFIIWSSNSLLNVFIKMVLCLTTMWSAYLLLGPTNLIVQLGN